jgi:hypothetical protein
MKMMKMKGPGYDEKEKFPGFSAMLENFKINSV